jgi:transposase
MEEFDRIRRMHFVEGMSVRAVARKTRIHRKTIRKMLTMGKVPGYRRQSEANRPTLGPVVPVIDAILKADRQAPRKQRHTAKRIWDRLKEEHAYQGGYTQIKAYVRGALLKSKEAFVPLAFDPGHAQVDWGEARVWEAGQSIKACLFVMTLPFSDGRFVAAFPRASLEFFLEGHLRAFEFFGGVPRRIIYDNLKSAVTKVGLGRERDLNPTFERFKEHCLFEAAFCNVGQGHEKGHVENGVGWAQRNLFTPQPTLGDWEGLIGQLVQACMKHGQRRLRGHERSVGERLAEERTHFLPIPTGAIRLCQSQPRTASSLCLVRFDTNDYSVPCTYAHHPVAVQADVGRVSIFFQDECIAVHRRSHRREEAIYEPWHYLALIERKPLVLDYGAPMKALELEDCFEVLRRRMEAGQRHSRGARAYIGVLRLLEKHPVKDLTRAVQRALELGVADGEAIKNLLLCPPECIPGRLDLSGRGHLRDYGVAPLKLTGYRALVQGGVS